MKENQEENKKKKGEKVSLEKTIHSITENYNNVEKAVAAQLKLQTPGHHPTVGSYREQVWKDLFERMIPHKFCIEQGVFIIDSKGQISNEVDLAIYDEMYTPYIFNYKNIKFIPIEAVAVAIQCKSENPGKIGLLNWADSVLKLRTSLNSYVRTMTDVIDNNIIDEENDRPLTQTSTRPILILCCAGTVGSIEEIGEKYDIILQTGRGNRLQKIMKAEGKSLTFWYETLNHMDKEINKEDKTSKKKPKNIEKTKRTLEELKVKGAEGKENIILSLTLQLNQLLMIINNPMQFPHAAYAEMFNKKLEKYFKQEEKKKGNKDGDTKKESNTGDL